MFPIHDCTGKGVTKRMKNRIAIAAACLAFGLLALYPLMKPEPNRETFSDWVFSLGAVGDDVYELQGRLKYLGFYNGKIDGVFGPKTHNAVTWFQWEFGLKPDGIVGPKTKLKLWEATKNWRPTAEDLPHRTGAGGRDGGAGGDDGFRPSNNLGLTQNDIYLMAAAVYAEARGEPYEGQVAVAAVILNRLRSPDFPDTVAGIIYQPGAFTSVTDGQISLQPDETAFRAVMDAINGWDPTDGCLFYFNPATATSSWIWSRPQYKRIGKHIFCR